MELQALKENQRRFLDFAESASDWFWETDENLRFTYISHGYRSSTGIDPSTYIGKTRQEATTENLNDEKWLQHFDDLANHRAFRDFIYKIKSSDGPSVPVRVFGKPVFAEDGAFMGYRGTGTDVSEQIKAQWLANGSSAMLVDAVESIPEGFLLFDENDRVVICNQNYRAAYGFLGRLLDPGTPFEDFARALAQSGVIPEARTDPEKWLRNRIRQHQNPGDPFVVNYEDGASILVSEFKTSEGGTAIIRSDITHQKKIEEDLHKSEERFRDFAEVATDWFWETDGKNRFTFISAQYGERIGVPVERIIGRSLQQAPPQHIDSDIWTSLVDDMVARKEFRGVMQPRILADGNEIWVSISGRPVFDDSGQFQGYRGTAIEITQRVKTEAELRESEQRFKDFSNVSSDWFWETDEENKFIYFSDQFEIITGINPDLLLGKTREETKPSNISDEAWQTLLEDMAAHRDFRNVILSRRRADGKDVWMSTSGTPYFDKLGNFKGYRCTGTDISNERKATNEIQRTQGLLYNAIEVLEDGFVLFDAEDRLVLSNQKYRDMYHAVADILKPGVSFTEIIQASADRDQIFDCLEDKDAWLKTRLEQHKNPTGPFDQKHTRGGWVRVIEQKTAEGGIVSLRIDITREKQEQQELRKLSHALEQSPSMVFITDVEGRIEYVNPMFTKISGYTADEAIGENPRILKSSETPANVYADLWRTIKSGHEWKGELKDRRKDGSKFWAYATISPVKDSDGEITNFVSMHEDITRRKEIELREVKARQQAEMANRAKSELLANMSHELRTPLNAIIGFSSMMKSETFGPLTERYTAYANDINKSGEHLLKLINDILDVSAIEAGKMEFQEEDLIVEELVEEAMLMVQSHAGDASVRLLCTIGDLRTMIYADRRRMMQIFLNLLSNAIKFTLPDGEVSINTALDSKGRHVFTVTDTGVGMNDDELAKAMSEFGQVDSGLDRKHEGAGLGLPLTRGLVELHGGTFEITSAKGDGTTVTLCFPVERSVASKVSS